MYRIFAYLLLCAAAFAAVVDRVAVVVGKTVFTQSEVEDEVRLNQLETAKPLDLSGARRKEAAERMIDQQLLRDEMAATDYQPPKQEDAAMLRQFRQQHFRTVALYHEALTRYGISEETLREHLTWQATALAFADERFKPLAAPTDAQSADRDAGSKTAELNEHPRDAAAKAKSEASYAEDPMDTWLKQQRASTRITFNAEAFK
jgi:hypothetical protein